MWTLEFVYRYWTSDFKISIIYARIYWLFHVKAKKSENKTKLNVLFVFLNFRVSHCDWASTGDFHSFGSLLKGTTRAGC